MNIKLWFDVEERYKAIAEPPTAEPAELWFDVEERYKAIGSEAPLQHVGCGLM